MGGGGSKDVQRSNDASVNQSLPLCTGVAAKLRKVQQQKLRAEGTLRDERQERNVLQKQLAALEAMLRNESATVLKVKAMVGSQREDLDKKDREYAEVLRELNDVRSKLLTAEIGLEDSKIQIDIHVKDNNEMNTRIARREEVLLTCIPPKQP
jgi:hypothetical protein